MHAIIRSFGFLCLPVLLHSWKEPPGGDWSLDTAACLAPSLSPRAQTRKASRPGTKMECCTSLYPRATTRANKTRPSTSDKKKDRSIETSSHCARINKQQSSSTILYTHMNLYKGCMVHRNMHVRSTIIYAWSRMNCLYVLYILHRDVLLLFLYVHLHVENRCVRTS